MTQFSRKLVSLAAAVAVVALAACGDDTEPNGNAPATPTGLAAAVQEDNSITVTWNASAGATSYTLERADESAPTTFAQVGGALTTTTYSDTDTELDVTYSYRVAATNADGTSAVSAVVTATPAGEMVATLTGSITASRTLYADTLYTLQGYVKVASGATLTIQPGTVIQGDFDTPGSSLWILKGAKIEANGSADAPIVFTSSRAAGSRAPGDWGGIVMIGNGISNRSGAIITEGPQGVGEQYSGGAGNTDDSGTLRYVRIEFAGYDVTGTGQELNSLSSYAIGSGTTYEYIQSMSGLDDSFEWWGGAVDGRYLISYESGDDHFDWTEGYVGRNQFVIAFQSARLQPAAGRGGLSSDPQGFEGDNCPSGEAGCDNGNSQEPFSSPVFANFTLVGPGTGTAITSSGDVGAVIRRGTAGYFTNGVIARFQRQGLSVRDAQTNDHMTAGDLSIVNILFAENGANYDADAGSNFGKAAAFTTSNHHEDAGTAASLFTSLVTTGLDWTPVGAATTVPTPIAIPGSHTTGFFGGTLTLGGYFGAADPAGAKWWQGWTNYAQN
ncbi:MAG TPA: hypothetical protein VFS94_10205 [Gemmatimonadales bacterium]|nr:hypothetical protein [Gemmatimonadales bacterium]